MAKSINDILSAAGLVPSGSVTSTRAPAVDAGSVFSDPVGTPMAAPSIGTGRVAEHPDLVAAAADAFRRARVRPHVRKAAKAADLAASRGRRTPAQVVGSSVRSKQADERPEASGGEDVQLVRARVDAARNNVDTAPPDKVVVVSQRLGKIIGRQG